MTKHMEPSKPIQPGSLQEFEAEARDQYLTALSEGPSGGDPHTRTLIKRMKEFSVEYPELGPEALWENMKERFPKVIWAFVAAVRKSQQ